MTAAEATRVAEIAEQIRTRSNLLPLDEGRMLDRIAAELAEMARRSATGDISDMPRCAECGDRFDPEVSEITLKPSEFCHDCLEHLAI